jgi:hypothetical protein
MIRQSPATWSAKQERLALLLASGKGIKAAAGDVAIGERTAHTWLDNPNFRVFVAELRGRILDEAVGRLVDSTTRAVETLVCLLDTGADGIRLRAAIGILESTIRLREHAELERRVASLEVADAEAIDGAGFAARGRADDSVPGSRSR